MTWNTSSKIMFGPVLVGVEVDLQHLPEYNYLEQCSNEKVFAAIDAIKLKEEEERAEK